MLPVKLPFVDIIQPQSNKFVTGDVKIKATGDSKLTTALQHAHTDKITFNWHIDYFLSETCPI